MVVSIFYSKQGWSKLVSLCILPIVSSLKDQRYKFNYMLFLSAERGESISIYFYKCDNCEREIFYLIKNRIKKWLRKNRLSYKKVMNENLWMNFDANSIHFDVIKMPIVSLVEVEDTVYIATSVSTQLQGFIIANEDFEAEDLVIYYILMYLIVFINASYKSDVMLCIETCIMNCMNSEGFINNDLSALNSHDINSDFEDNKENILNFYRGLDVIDDEYLNKWNIFCKKSILSLEDDRFIIDFVRVATQYLSLAFNINSEKNIYVLQLSKKFIGHIKKAEKK